MTPSEQTLTDAKALRLVIPFIVGDLAGWLLRDFCHSYWFVFAIACLPIFFALVIFGRHRLLPGAKHFAILVYLFFTLLGATLLLRSYHKTVVAWPGVSQFHQGVIISSLQLKGKTTVCDVQLLCSKAEDRWIKDNQRLRLTFFSDSAVSTPHIGDALMFYGQIKPPCNLVFPSSFDYASWLHRKGISGTIFVGNDYQIASDQFRFQLYQRLSKWQVFSIRARQLQQSLLKQYAPIASNTKEYAVISALTLGDKYSLTHDIRTLFSETGASHVLALSGLHLGILVSVLLFLFTPLLRTSVTRFIALSLCLLLIWLFTFLTGMNVSLVRAATMYSLALLFFARHRQGVPINHLALAALLILFFQPMSLMDIGFQLSFLSVFAILFFQPIAVAIRPRNRIWAWITDFIYVAVVAQLTTAPLVAYSFHVLPLAFLLSNIVVIPCAYVLLSASLCLFVLSPFSLFPLWLYQILTSTAHFMLNGLEIIHKIPFSSIEIYPSWVSMMLCYFLLVTCVILWFERNRNSLILTMLILTLLLGSIIYHHRPGKITNQIVCYNIPSCPAIQFVVSEKESALWVADTTQYSRVCAVAKTFWGENQMEPPQVFVKELASEHISCQHGIVSFNGKLYVTVCDDEWKDKTSAQPLDVEVLYVTKKCKWQLPNLKKLFKPHKIVLL